MNNSIPKIIHYCWVGGNPKPASVIHCIESWKKYCPDYEIREWNESNYDFTKNLYMKQAYDSKKWGFVPDYARLDIIYNYGGIYLDTDVEIIRNFDDLLSNESFFGFEDTGENSYFISCGLGFGAKKNNLLIKKLREYYNNVSFYDEYGNLDLTPAPKHNENVFLDLGLLMNNKLQIINNNVFYPSDYFCPKIFKTGKTKITKNTFSIHHFTASWMDESIRSDISHNQKICSFFGQRIGKIVLIIESIIKKYGIIGCLKKLFIYLYESLYLFLPIIHLRIKNIITNNKENNKIILFDTSLESKNLGDSIIMENCKNQLSSVIDISDAMYLPTQRFPNKIICQGKLKILCGTNILSCRMDKYKLWKLPHNLTNYNDIVLLGVGFDNYNTKSNLYTRLLLKSILSKNKVHSVRDSFSEATLKKMGIKNVVNTSCPTMWGLTEEHCKKIPHSKAENVICTLTDYNQDEKIDSEMLNILFNNYKTVYLWLQGQDDYNYVKQLGYVDKVTLVDSSIEAYDNILKQNNLDYVGTRLHAGIRALSKGHRTLIVSIDNRAECIHADTNLPIIPREAISLLLYKTIHSSFDTNITLPSKNIEIWKNQFKNRC